LTIFFIERGVLFHTDAVAAAGHLPVEVKELGVEKLRSFSPVWRKKMAAVAAG